MHFCAKIQEEFQDLPFNVCGEATNTNFIGFGLTQPGLEPMIYRI
jgi:hypothetical protein